MNVIYTYLFRLCVPRPAPSPPPARWRAFVCRSSGRPASARYFSATAPLRSPLLFARRPWSRLGNPARLEPLRGKASIPPGVVHARRTSVTRSFQPIFRRQPARQRSAPIRITPLLFANQTKCKKKQPPHPKRRAAVAAVVAPPTITPNSPPSHQR